MKYNNSKEFYPAYSLKMIEELRKCGFKPFDTFTHIKTNKYCEVYTMTEELSAFLSDWSLNKKNY